MVTTPLALYGGRSLASRGLWSLSRSGAYLTIAGTGQQRRRIHVSLTHTPTDTSELLQWTTLPETRNQYFLAANLERLNSIELANNLIAVGTPPERITLIVSADQWKRKKPASGFGKAAWWREELEQILKEKRFHQVLVVGGSSPRATSRIITRFQEPGSRNEGDVAYRELCELIKNMQQRLALVFNIYEEPDRVEQQILVKEEFQPYCYFTPPIYFPGAIPPKTRRLLEDLVRTGRAGIGVVTASAALRSIGYASPAEFSSKPRVSEVGVDRWLIPTAEPGESEEKYIGRSAKATLEWFSLLSPPGIRKDLRFYTRFFPQSPGWERYLQIYKIFSATEVWTKPE